MQRDNMTTGWGAYTSTQSKHGIEKAKKAGLVVRFPTEDEIFIDIDTQEQLDNCRVLYSLFVGLRTEDFTYEWCESKNGGVHMVIKASFPYLYGDNSKDLVRVLLQAVLGSETKRELLAVCRLLDKDPHPTFFADKPENLPYRTCAWPQTITPTKGACNGPTT